MEFYLERRSDRHVFISRFNSQRDGILLEGREDSDEDDEEVSIPNGMEFYVKHRVRDFSQSRVSIPNGMEFYEE